MQDQDVKQQTLTSDPKILHKIKYLQFRRQMIPLGIVIILMILNIIWPFKYMLYPTLLAFFWYLLERAIFRTKNKIPVPDENAFLSPVDGKVTTVRQGDDMTFVTIKKSFVDVAEVRLPYPGMQRVESDKWRFETPKGEINVHVKAENIRYFDGEQIHGAVVGVLPAGGVFSFYFPPAVKVQVLEKEVVAGGETALFSFADDPEPVQEQKSILVEEPVDDKINEDFQSEK
jgi:hypothetical protein